MNWDSYKRLADNPGYYTRWMLEQCLALVEHAHWQAESWPWSHSPRQQRQLAVKLKAVLQSAAVAKPADHKGGPATDLLVLSLTVAEIHRMLAVVQTAVDQSVYTVATQGRGLGGFIEAWQETLASRTLNGQRPNQQTNLDNSKEPFMSQASSVVLELIDGFNRMDIDAIGDCFTENAVYHNMPMDPVNGRTNIKASLEPFVGNASKIQWDVLSIAENAQGHVLTERVDRFEIGGSWIVVEVMGICEITDGKISAWRDYFDLAQFQQQMAGASA